MLASFLHVKKRPRAWASLEGALQGGIFGSAAARKCDSARCPDWQRRPRPVGARDAPDQAIAGTRVYAPRTTRAAVNLDFYGQDGDGECIQEVVDTAANL